MKPVETYFGLTADTWATVAVGLTVAVLAGLDLVARVVQWCQRKRDLKYLRPACLAAIASLHDRATREAQGRHAGRGTSRSGFAGSDLKAIDEWKDRMKGLAEIADGETLRKLVLRLEPLPTLPLSSADIMGQEAMNSSYDLVTRGLSLIENEMKRREKDDRGF